MGSDIGSIEKSKTLDEAAAALRAIADQLADGSSLDLDFDEEAVTVGLADPVAYELELEREENELELEIELEWRDPERDAGAETAAVDEKDADAEPAGDVDPEGAAVADADPATESRGQFQLFRDRADEWRWRLVHQNGNVIATSGEGYTRKRNAEKGLQSTRENAPGAEVVEVDE